MTPTWVRVDEVLWRESLGRTVLLPPGHDEPVVLVGSGMVLWQLLAHPMPVERLGEALAEAYEVTPGQAAADVLPVLRHLERLGAARCVEAPA